MLNVKMPHLDHYTRQRQANAERYGELFAAAGLDRCLGLPGPLPGRRHVWNQYVVRVPGGQRDALREHSWPRPRSAREIYYPLGLHEQDVLSRTWATGGATCPRRIVPPPRCWPCPSSRNSPAGEQQIVVDRIAAFAAKASDVGGVHPVPAPKSGLARRREQPRGLIANRAVHDCRVRPWLPDGLCGAHAYRGHVGHEQIAA